MNQKNEMDKRIPNTNIQKDNSGKQTQKKILFTEVVPAASQNDVFVWMYMICRSTSADYI